MSINKRSLRKNGNGKGALTTIVLGHGEHIEEGRYVTLKCPVHILGSNDVLDHSNIIVVGGFAVHRNVLGTYYNITIRQSKEHGVRGYSSFFTLEEHSSSAAVLMRMTLYSSLIFHLQH